MSERPSIRLTFRFGPEQECIVECFPQGHSSTDVAAQERDGDDIGADLAVDDQVSVSGQRHVDDPEVAPKIWRPLEEDNRGVPGVGDGQLGGLSGRQRAGGIGHFGSLQFTKFDPASCGINTTASSPEEAA